MVKLKSKINLFDIFAVLAIILTVVIVAIAYNNKLYLGNKTVLVEVQITDDAEINRVLPELKNASEVYYSGSKYPVEQVAYRTETDTTGGIDLYITLSGLGDISTDDSIFNGQRIFVNEKVEIRSDYYVQGYVTDYHYE